MALREDNAHEVDQVQPDREIDSYIRGAGGVRVDGRRVAGYVLAIVALILAVLAAVFTGIAVHHNSRATSLKEKGVPVQVTVTGCVGMASGTGITGTGFTCKGGYTLAGHHYVETIGGSADLLTVDEKVAGIAVRDEPTVVYTAGSVANMHSTWTVYITPGALLVAVIGTVLLRRRVRHAPTA